MSETVARKRGRRGSPESWSVDAHVGQRVRMRRTLLGMSQERLGEAIGLTFQQVQKYERGSNRISAGTLYRLSQVLDVPVSFFFDNYRDMQSNVAPTDGRARSVEGGTGISRRDARLLRLWRNAPPAISDEILSLLASLSPHLSDPREGEEPVDATLVAARTDGDDVALVGEITTTSKRKPRRRHGAVWDPADIYRSRKAPPTRA